MREKKKGYRQQLLHDVPFHIMNDEDIEIIFLSILIEK